jgi:hypothetical protein
MRISDRRFLILAALPVCACHNTGESAEQLVAAAQEDHRVIECRVDGAAHFTPDCFVERRKATDGSSVLVLRHSQGGFRRVQVSDDGRRINQADGAEQMQMIGKAGQGIEISVGDDHYRITPSQLKAR